jgi:endonuclease YncB( thermonuclease family)
VNGPIRVIEADTLEVWIDGTRVGVGVIGITAPPGNTACGKEAIRTAADLTSGGILLEEALGLPAFDRRSRRMYRVITSNGRELGIELALAGLAAADPSAKAAQEFSSIHAAEQDARIGGRGCLWSEKSIPQR